MPVNPIRDGWNTVTPYLTIDGAAAALDFYKKAFGAEEVERHPGPGGKVMHAEIRIGDSRIMLSDEFPQMGGKGPRTLGGTPVALYVNVRDCDAVFNRAVAAGAKVVRAVQNEFYGDRAGTLTDPFGHKWTVASHVEDVSSADLKRRMAEMTKKGGGS